MDPSLKNWERKCRRITVWTLFVLYFVCLPACLSYIVRTNTDSIYYILLYSFYLFVCLSVCTSSIEDLHTDRIYYILLYSIYLLVCLSVCTSSIEDLHTDRTYYILFYLFVCLCVHLPLKTCTQMEPIYHILSICLSVCVGLTS